MKTKILIASLLIVATAKSQDIITKNDSSKLKTTVVEISPTVVSYKLFNYSDGPLIKISKTEIAYITFKNGFSERYSQPSQPVIINYDQVQPTYSSSYGTVLTPEQKDARCEKLYKYKNNIGFNYIAFLNNCIGFNYMRDIKKANLVINVPIAFGFDKPVVTNGLYNDGFVESSSKFSYDKLNYQIGLSAMFTPNMKRSVNFLVGPSFYYTSFKVSTELNYTIPTTTGNQSEQFKNTFELKRRNYGINVGFLGRYSDRINMTMIVTLGYKLDSYNETDPFGVDYISSINGNHGQSNNSYQNNTIYANYMWSVGYRF